MTTLTERNVLIRRLEELVTNAWPAVTTLLYDGWVLRMAGGYTRRANSVSPLYPSTLDVDEKITECERLFREAKLLPVFKMTHAAHPVDLEERLHARGYLVGAETSVQIADLAAVDPTPPDGVTINPTYTGPWLKQYCRMSLIDESRQMPLKAILDRIPLPSGYVLVHEAGQAVACGLGVVEGDWLGIFNVVADPASRGRGHGRRLMSALLAWGRGQGASQANLSVMADNTPALKLYAGAGFNEIYRYWYRVGQ